MGSGFDLERANGILSLFGSGLKDLKSLTDSINNVGQTVNSIKSSKTDNAVKLSNAETDAKKEDNRHDEAMANLELEYKKLQEASEKGELKRSALSKMLDMFEKEYNKLVDLSVDLFLSEDARLCRENLRVTLIEITKEIMK